MVGLDVYNDNKQDVGQIKDIALNQNGQTQAYISPSVVFSGWANVMSRSTHHR